MSFVVASAAYPIGTYLSWAEIEDKWKSFIQAAFDGSGEGTPDLLLLPEYGAIEAALSIDETKARDLSGQLEVMAIIKDRYLRFWCDMARQFNVHIVSPSLPFRLETGMAVNRAHFHTPDGALDFQDKMIPTPFEREMWGMTAGAPLKLFETRLGKLAVLICYDCEFPLLARAAVEAGADLLLVPSCTDSLDGYWRVRIGAMARALESQCYVMHAALIGQCNWSPSTDENIGAAGIYGPPDLGFPDNGVIAAGGLNEAGWVKAAIEPDKIIDVRRQGAVRLFSHWPEQEASLNMPVETVALLGECSQRE